MWHLVWYCFGFWLLDWFFVWFLFQIILIMNKVQRLVNNQVEIHLIVKVHSLRKINDVPFYQFYSFWNVWILSKRFLNLTLAVRLFKSFDASKVVYQNIKNFAWNQTDKIPCIGMSSIYFVLIHFIKTSNTYISSLMGNVNRCSNSRSSFKSEDRSIKRRNGFLVFSSVLIFNFQQDQMV